MSWFTDIRTLAKAIIGPPRPVQPPLYECQCMTKAQPWIDVACPLHGHLIRGLRNAVAARQREEGR